MSTPTLSVIVPTRDRPEHLAACLVALRAVLRAGDELVVVDSASRDPSVAEVALGHGARVVRCERPGVSLARNEGARAAAHDVLAYVDDDVRVVAGWADAVATTMADPTVAFSTGRVAVPEDQHGRQREVAIKDDPVAARLDRDSPSPLGSSANLGIRREVLLGVGGFDEAMGGGARFEAAEDLDLFDRLFAAGHVGRYDPAAAAYHDQWRDRSGLLRLDWRYGLGAGARLAKLVRSDRARARRAAHEVLWEDGLCVLGRSIRAREEFAIATVSLRIAGTLVGLAWAVLVPVRAGHFRSSRGTR
jgi:glycosyltransferase involved in cell wall biosynthesis